MLELKDIRVMEVELSSNCNARCPFCLRNFAGVEINRGYTVNTWTLEQFCQAFDHNFISQLDEIIFEGNFGDPGMCRDLPEILEYIRSINKHMHILIYTNGSMHTPDWWASLAKFNPKIYFALDGASQETHCLHRIQTNFDKIIENASAFIEQGGIAVWRLIKLSTNQHEIEHCEKMSQELGFSGFETYNDSRTQSPVFNKDQSFAYDIGNKKASKNFQEYYDFYKQSSLNPENRKQVLDYQIPDQVTCYSLARNYIYVDHSGDVYPCCYLGCQPRTFDQAGGYQRIGNDQTMTILDKNNIFENGLNDSINWFNRIPNKWQQPNTFDRLLVCDNTCGGCKKK